MKPIARDYAGRTRNPIWERELAHTLRTLPEPERFEFLNELLVFHSTVALLLARRCLKSKEYFQVLLDRALRECHAGNIRPWFACVVPKLGMRRVIHSVKAHAADSPNGFEAAKYWLPMFAKDAGCSAAEVDELLAEAPGPITTSEPA
jgi:hypothetical protein